MNYMLLYVSIGCLGIYYMCSHLLTARRRAAVCKANGCKPVKQVPQNPFFFGFDIIFLFQRLLKDGMFMDTSAELLEEYGGTFCMGMGGGKPVWTREPENVKTMLTSRAEDFDIPWMRIKAFYPVTGDSAFSSKGPVWSHGRALLRPAFTKLQISNFDIYEKNFQKFSKLIPSDGSTVDLQELFKRFTLDTASEILFGDSVNSLDENVLMKDISDAFDYASKEVFARSNLGLLIFLHWDPKFTYACKVLDAYIKEFVDKAINFRALSKHIGREDGQQSSKKRYIFLEELAKDTSDRKFLRDQLAGNLAAGRDTTAGLLTTTFWLLARHPQALQALRSEVTQLEGELPTYEQLNSMTYLRWVLNESKLILTNMHLYYSKSQLTLYFSFSIVPRHSSERSSSRARHGSS
jgi:cytochrome P450